MDQYTNLPFNQYIARSQLFISKHRIDLGSNPHAERIITANAPFELYPASTTSKYRYGALLIHGLFDCPFTMREIGYQLQAAGIPSKAVLLPGHGTNPADLITVNYQDWVEVVRYGINTLAQEVDKLILIGYSTGAALSVYHAFDDKRITGLVLMAPAIKIKAPVAIIQLLQQIKAILGQNNDWILTGEEIDYTKYRSIAYNSVMQVAQLTVHNTTRHAKDALHCPMLMLISDADETISSKHAIEFFKATKHDKSQLLLYTANGHGQHNQDPRIKIRNAAIELNIRHFSHVALPFSINNPHYGINGDHPTAPKQNESCIYGSYNRITMKMYDLLHQYGLIKQPRRGLTYNPDFSYMIDTILKFINHI